VSHCVKKKRKKKVGKKEFFLVKVVKKVVKKVFKKFQKVDNVSLVILCDTGSHLKEKINKGVGWVGGQIVVPRPSASASLTGQRQKAKTMLGFN
jgi:hypothetical protein